MAKKSKINKTQAVRDYLTAHPEAMSSEIAAALTKQGIKINAGYAANIKTSLKKEIKKPAKKVAAKKTAKKKVAVEVAVPVIVEKPVNGGTITLEQVKKVAHTIQMLGGFQRVIEVLEVIKELGGVKKFKDLAEAMSATVTDDIPF